MYYLSHYAGAAGLLRAIGILSLLISGAEAQIGRRVPPVIDESRLVRLSETTHPLARVSAGRVAAGQVMDRMLLVLKPSDEQQAALDELIVAQQDAASPEFHHWLTPAEFGARFSPSADDISVLSAWLESKGFVVNAIPAGRRSIEFSGTVGQVEQAFHTEMHRYVVNGARHIANKFDIAIPAGIASVAAGIVSLNDFRTIPQHRVAMANPQTNLSNGGHALAPADFATIYNVSPLWNSGADGTGQTIAVVGRTNISPADVAQFRTQFGLPSNNTQVIVNGPDPGILSGGELTEALLDVEWAGAVAPGATVKFVTSANTSSTGGDVLSAQYIVNNNVGSVLSTSFGLCEASLGSGNAFFNSLWQQAAAQGISVIVAAGDSGSAGCDPAGSATPASRGPGINGIASTPYNVAIGGTQFNDTSAPAAFWANVNTPGTYGSALGYIPEVVWNESSYIAGGAGNSLYAGAGGVSRIYPSPLWQVGTNVPVVDPGTANGHHRYIPDVSLSGAGHDAYLVIQNGGLIGVGGTSAGAPSFAGMMALRNHLSNERTGNPAPALYAMNAQYPGVFHDVVTGTNSVPCVTGSPGCNATSPATGMTSGFAAGPGYDLATGLGSIDAYAMVTNWPRSAPAPTPAIASLNPDAMTGSDLAQTLTISGSGFVSAAVQVVVGYPGFSTNATILSATATQVQVLINVGITARTWTVQVVNANGISSGPASLSVRAPIVAPVIASVVQNLSKVSGLGSLFILRGSGFANGAKVLLSAPGVTVEPTYVSAAPTQIVIQARLANIARVWTVQVVNPDSGASNLFTLQVQ